MKKKLVLRPLGIVVFYGLFLVLVVIGLFFSIKFSSTNENLTYVSKAILDEYVPVVNTSIEEKIIKPYVGDNITIETNYYDYQDENKEIGSIIYYENTYIQNPGINYKSDTKFDILSISSGEVIDITEDNLLGKTITIKHNNNLVSVYSMVDDIKVEKGKKVLTGEVIATSGTSTLSKDNFNLHFELYVNGEVVNPENYYDKYTNEI